MSLWLIRLILLKKTLLWNVHTPIIRMVFTCQGAATEWRVHVRVRVYHVWKRCAVCTNFICVWSVQYNFIHDRLVTTSHVPVCECLKSNYMHHVATITLVTSKALSVWAITVLHMFAQLCVLICVTLLCSDHVAQDDVSYDVIETLCSMKETALR